MEAKQWTDGRLDDAFREVRDDISGLGQRFDKYVETQAEREEAHRRERKTDLRWIVGTIIGAAAVVVAALGLILGAN